ncbi:hypothetical protein KAU32_12600 [bacterium]|nr:hypothetical protein [bacterium]
MNDLLKKVINLSPIAVLAIAIILLTSCKLENTSPHISGISVPSTIISYEGARVTCNAEDPDGDSLSYDWDFPADDYATVDYYPPSGGSKTITCIVSDGEDSVSSSATTYVVMRYYYWIQAVFNYSGDIDLALYNSSYSCIDSSTSGSSYWEQIDGSLDSGTYYIKVYLYSGESGYELENCGQTTHYNRYCPEFDGYLDSSNTEDWYTLTVNLSKSINDVNEAFSIQKMNPKEVPKELINAQGALKAD